MIKEIHYTGYNTVPSDYECPDGQLAASMNLIAEDGHLRPVFQPTSLAELPEGYSVVYIHKTSAFTHYILRNESINAHNLYWIYASLITDSDEKPVSSETIVQDISQQSNHRLIHGFGNDTDIYEVNGIGNTLVVLTSDGMHYALWKSETEGYLYLGTHLPELPISFGLQGEVVRSDTFDVKTGSTTMELDEEHQISVTSQVLAKVNKFIEDEATGSGKFLFPFLVRYAYRLYDETLIMHSSPVLMLTATNTAPAVIVDSYLNVPITLQDCRVVGVCHELDYAVLNQSFITALRDWKDIVKSVDVFISRPIYTYDQNGKITDLGLIVNGDKTGHDIDSGSLCKHVNQHADLATTDYPLTYQYRDLDSLYAFTFTPDSLREQLKGLIIPGRSEWKIKEDIRTVSQFYLLRSIRLEDLSTDRTVLHIEDDYLQSLVTREVMTDDYDSHDTIIPRYSFGYNSRLNIADITKRLHDTYTGALLCFSNDYVDYNSVSYPHKQNCTYDVYIKIRQDGKEIVVSGGSYYAFAYNTPLLYLYYPNANAYEAVVVCHDPNSNTSTRKSFPLERHSMLNGAFFFAGWYNALPMIDGDEHPVVSVGEGRTVAVPNKIYTSDVNNPFHFSVSGINTVGTGIIIGMSAAVKAMSQGQFGQFPLYAFTTEGVFALDVSQTGTYSAVHPVSRDVCISPESITQIDSSVLFATSRGIMQVSGSQTQCITDDIFSEAPFNVLDLPGIDQLHAKLGHSVDTCLPIQPFLGFLADCQMVYDYVHQRIFVYNPTMENGAPKYTYAYVYSLKSRQWGMMYSCIASSVNSFPDAMCMTFDNRLVSFCGTDEETSKGLYITRPLKFEAADVLKTVSALIQRGTFRRGDVGTVLYGSRDLYTWRIVWTSKDHNLRRLRGTPYKYFRIAGLTALTEGKSVFGASVEVDPRQTDILR